MLRSPVGRSFRSASPEPIGGLSATATPPSSKPIRWPVQLQIRLRLWAMTLKDRLKLALLQLRDDKDLLSHAPFSGRQLVATTNRDRDA